jgi:hypothetical protein
MGIVILLCGLAVIALLILGVPWLARQMRFEEGFKLGVQEANTSFKPVVEQMQRQLTRAHEQAELSYQRGYLDAQKNLGLPAKMPMVLELGENLEIRQKPRPRLPKETK